VLSALAKSASKDLAANSAGKRSANRLINFERFDSLTIEELTNIKPTVITKPEFNEVFDQLFSGAAFQFEAELDVSRRSSINCRTGRKPKARSLPGITPIQKETFR